MLEITIPQRCTRTHVNYVLAEAKNLQNLPQRENFHNKTPPKSQLPLAERDMAGWWWLLSVNPTNRPLFIECPDPYAPLYSALVCVPLAGVRSPVCVVN